MNQPKVSIIILNWNGLQDTIECLESLKKVTYPNCEITVVDNGSKGDDVKILRERYGNNVHIIANEKNYTGRKFKRYFTAAATARLWPACASGRCSLAARAASPVRSGCMPQRHAARTGAA